MKEEKYICSHCHRRVVPIDDTWNDYLGREMCDKSGGTTHDPVLVHDFAEESC
jgi:hypothetical protein